MAARYPAPGRRRDGPATRCALLDNFADRVGLDGIPGELLARLRASLLQREIAPHGVVPGQFAQLLTLYDRDGQTPTELARAVGIEPVTER
jgi:hypothetical protein